MIRNIVIHSICGALSLSLYTRHQCMVHHQTIPSAMSLASSVPKMISIMHHRRSANNMRATSHTPCRPAFLSVPCETRRPCTSPVLFSCSPHRGADNNIAVTTIVVDATAAAYAQAFLRGHVRLSPRPRYGRSISIRNIDVPPSVQLTTPSTRRWYSIFGQICTHHTRRCHHRSSFDVRAT